MTSKVTVLGAGSWGVTLGRLLCGPEKDVWLWGRNKDKMAAMDQTRVVDFPMEMPLPRDLNITSDLTKAVRDADVVVMVVTTSGTREVAEQLQKIRVFSEKTIILSASKGIEYPTLQTMTQIIDETLPNNPVAVLSGPNLAPEINKGLPTAAVVACKSLDVAEYLQHLFSTDKYRIYTNTDVIGVELGGALKNIFAIVSGYMDAKNLGDNAKSTLITRGLAEITRFSVMMGADPRTLYGLSGLGDLLATCNSPLSRNYQVGYRLAKGKKLQEVLDELKMVAEGVKTTYAVSRLSDKIGIEVPVVKQVEHAIKGDFSETEIIHTLMSRKLKAEHAGIF